MRLSRIIFVTVFLSAIANTSTAAKIEDVVTLTNVNAFVDKCIDVFTRKSVIEQYKKELLSQSDGLQNSFVWTTRVPVVAQECFPSNHYSAYHSDPYRHYPKLGNFFYKNPIALANKITIGLVDKMAKFTPRLRGEYEKTSDYEAAILKDKEEYLKEFGDFKINANLYGFVWNYIVGDIGIGDEKPVYNADKEVLTLKVKSKSYGFHMPFEIKLSPSDAKKLSEAFDGIGIYALKLNLTVYVDGDDIIMKELSLLPKTYREKEYQDLGINLMNLPVNGSLKNVYGRKANSMFEANLLKLNSAAKK